MIAFAPLLFVPGASGKFFRVIPLVVIVVLILSLVESLFILPAHLAHIDDTKGATGIFGWIDRKQKRFAVGLQAFVENSYQPFVRRLLKHRYLTLVTSVAFSSSPSGLSRAALSNSRFFPRSKVTAFRPV